MLLLEFLLKLYYIPVQRSFKEREVLVKQGGVSRDLPRLFDPVFR